MDLGTENLQGLLDKFGKLSRSTRTAMLPVIAILVGALYVYFLYMPAREALAQAKAEQLQLERKLSEVRSVAANEEAVRKEIEILEKKLEVALRQLPDSKELPVLLTDITSLGKNAGLDFRAFRPKDEVRREFYAEVPIDIEFTGRFHDVAVFFDEVARLPRIVNVGELDVTIAEESAMDTVLKVKGIATTFRFVEPEPASQAAPAGGPRRQPGAPHAQRRRGH